jgi:hypothetical protein
LILAVFCTSLVGAPANVRALTLPYQVTVNVTPLSGTPAQIAFDFIDGDAVEPSNTVTISAFSTDGILGEVITTGGSSENLPGKVTLTDTVFFNEYLQNITLGTTISFLLDSTTNGPPSGQTPDAFSFLILNQATGLPLFATTDTLGADTLFMLDIDGSAQGALSVYSALEGEATWAVTPVPEPGTLLLLGSGLASLLIWRRRPR